MVFHHRLPRFGGQGGILHRGRGGGGIGRHPALKDFDELVLLRLGIGDRLAATVFEFLPR